MPACLGAAALFCALCEPPAGGARAEGDAPFRLVYESMDARVESGLYVVPVDGSKPAQPLAPHAGLDRNPFVSPNGRWVLFLSSRWHPPETLSLVPTVLDLDTAELRALAGEGFWNTNAGGWHPTRPWFLAQVACQGARRSEFWLIDVGTGTHEVLLAGEPVTHVGGWFPDGDAFLAAIETEAGTRVRRYDLVARKLDLLPVPDKGEHGAFDLSRDGTKLALIAFEKGFANSQIHIVDLTTGKSIAVPAPEAKTLPTRPLWSPDGRLLAVFVKDPRARSPAPGMPEVWIRGPGATTLWICRADGTHARRVDFVGTAAAWSPDGRLLAYERPRPRPGELFPDVDIYVADVADDRIVTRAITDSIDTRDANPAWLPPRRKP